MKNRNIIEKYFFKRIFLFLFVFFLVSSVFAFGSKEKPAAAIQVTGVVRLTGPSLFPELVISGSDTIWYVAADEINKLMELQHQTVTLEAEETVTELKFANGMSAGTRRELKNIRIISIN